MGTIPILEKTCSIEGEEWVIECFTTTSDMLMEKDGSAWLGARLSTAEGTTHGCVLPLHLVSDRFLRDFTNVFCTRQDFRDRCAYNQAGVSALGVETANGTKLPKLPMIANPKRDQHVARLVKLGGKAKFRDFSTLRSGRDVFSTMKVEVLEAQLADGVRILDECIQAHGSDLEDSERTKALRWMARGLPAGLALRKVLVDLELSKNARRA